LALGDGLRETHRFVDRSGRASETGDLLRRFAKRGRHAALGGVEAARHYMPTFDLNGLPRIDVSVTSADDLTWVKKIDPALAETPMSPSSASPLLVVHRLRRPEPRFDGAAGVAFADPAEVLLDLHELRLVDQADEFVHALRESARRSCGDRALAGRVGEGAASELRVDGALRPSAACRRWVA
jgi:hypothetical protein